MKLEKDKIVMVLIIASVVLFIVSYAIITFGKKEEATFNNNRVLVPKLEKKQKQYETKMEALEGLEEDRQLNAPSVYNDRLLDNMRYYQPQQDSIRKQHMIDSIYSLGQKRSRSLAALRRLEDTHSHRSNKATISANKNTITINKNEITVDAKELGLEHQLFFASNPKNNSIIGKYETDAQIFVQVDGTQTVKKDFRLRMRLLKEATIRGYHFPRSTPIYGFVSFKPNRTMISITHVNNKPVKLKAYDFEDGDEGIYIQNSFREEVRQKLGGDLVDDIDIPGVPQVSGIKQLFRRNNRQVKVTVMDNYQLILKSKL